MADPTIIARDTFISGRVQGDDDLVVQGRVDGTVILSETLTIGADGRVDGDIQARQVVVEGRFQGTIEAEERVVLATTALAVAEVRAPVVEMADGARLRGELAIGVDATPSGREATTGRRRSGTPTARSATPSRSGTKSRPARGSASTARAAEPSSAATTTTVVEESTEEEEEPSEPQAEPEEPALSDELVEQYRRDFTVKELREKLRERDLRVSGTKDELIERLLLAEQ